MRGWEEPEVQEEVKKGNRNLIDLMEEVPLTAPVTSEQSYPMIQLSQSVALILTPPVSVPVLTPPSSKPIFVFPDEELQDMERRWTVLKSGQSEVDVEAQGHRKPYFGMHINMPESNKVDVEIDAAKSQARRIAPIPISLPLNQPSVPGIRDVA